jgi:hypothetical protein
MSRSHRYQESAMNSQPNTIETKRYARHVAVGKRIYLDVDRDVICGRKFDFTQHFLPEGLSFVGRLEFLHADERRLMSSKL